MVLLVQEARRDATQSGRPAVAGSLRPWQCLLPIHSCHWRGRRPYCWVCYKLAC